MSTESAREDPVPPSEGGIGVSDLETRRIKDRLGRAPRLLLVTTYLAPALAVGGRRVEAIAEGLVRQGWEVTILAPESRYTPPVDPRLHPPEGCRILRTRMIPLSLRVLAPRWSASAVKVSEGEGEDASPGHTPRSDGPLLAWIKHASRQVLYRGLGVRDQFAGWTPFALRAVRGLQFDVVLASVPGFQSATIARKIARKTGAALVLDYRDPWTEGLTPSASGLTDREIRRSRRQEDRCLAAADLVVGVSPTLCRWLEARTGRPCRLVLSGADVGLGQQAASPDEAPSATASRPATVVYAGSLAYGRSLAPIARVLSDSGLPVRLVYLGPHAERAARQVEDAGPGVDFQARGVVHLAESRRALEAGEAGLVLVSPGYEYAIPGKLYEVVGAGKPVLLLAPAGADAGHIVRQHGLGWVHAPGDREGIRSSLATLAQGGRPHPRDLEALTVETMQDTWARLLRDLLDERAGSLHSAA